MRYMSLFIETEDNGQEQMSLILGTFVASSHDANTLFSAGLTNYK